MQNLISDFIACMDGNSLSPADPSQIIPDNKRHDYQLAIDPPRVKKGYYKLKIDGDFGFGFFGDYRMGEHISWHSKGSKRLTATERQALNTRIQKEKEAAEAAQLKEWEEKAWEAREFLVFIPECQEHPYLTKKGIKPNNTGIYQDKLIILMNDENETWNYQTIDPQGEKRFLSGARKQGTWHLIPGDSDTVCICEGFATGASINEATGFHTVIAFDAGNLVAVAPKIKKLYPDSKIIICGDNDDFPEKKQINIGVKKALEAARLIDSYVIYPDNINDFNDLAQLSGHSAVRDRIQAAWKIQTLPSPEPEKADPPGISLPPEGSDSKLAGGTVINGYNHSHNDDENAWMGNLLVDSKGRTIPKSCTNLKLFMRHHDTLKGVFQYNKFSKQIIITRCPPWEEDQTFQVRPLRDADYFNLESYMEQSFNILAGRNKCAEAIEAIALLPENTSNPATHYFKSLLWDRVPRLDGWIEKYVSRLDTVSSDYLSLISRKFMCGLAARAIFPGIKFDTMLILEGRQYAGKSFLSRILGTINDTEYFLDDFRDIDNKDALMKMQGKLVVEFPELSTFRSAEIQDLKGFLTRTHDVFRPPFGRNVIESPRQCVFVGTVNPEGPYLKDVTGNRRFWPVVCRKDIDLGGLKSVIHQLHAEAAFYVLHNEQLWLTESEYDLCTIHQNERLTTDIWTDRVEYIISQKEQVTTDEILSGLEIPMDRRTPQISSRISKMMFSLGWSAARIMMNGRKLRGFQKNEHSKPEQQEIGLTFKQEGDAVRW